MKNDKTFFNHSIPSVWKLIIAILVCEGVGLLSGFLTRNEMTTWFATLNKPSWNPPSWVFGPVWTTLYLLMAISVWLVWKSHYSDRRKESAMTIFAVQLFFNFCWSIIFFSYHSPAWAFVDILLLIITIVMTMISFSSMSKVATLLLVPYLLWVCFASFLNYTIWSMN